MFDRRRPQELEGGGYHLFSSTLIGLVRTWGPLVAVLSFTVWVRIFQLGVFYGRDELVIWRWSDEFFTALWHGNLANSVADSNYPGITIFWLQSLYNYLKYGFLWLASGHAPVLDAIVGVPRSLPHLAERRLVMGLATSAQVWGVYLLATKAYNRRLALLATFLVASDPFFLAESRVLRAEALAAGFMILSILAWLVYVREGRWRYLALSGIMAGWAILTKVSSGFLVLIVGLLLLLDLLFGHSGTWRTRLKLNLGRGVAWGSLTIASFWLSWPTLWVNPGPPLDTIIGRGIAQASRSSVWHGDVFFAGRLIPDDPGLFFYPLVIAFRSTPLVWLGGGLALILLGRSLFKNGQLKLTMGQVANVFPPERWSWPVISIGTWLVYIGVMFIGLSLTLSKVDRYLLPIFLALDIFAALGLVGLFDWIKSRAGYARGIAYSFVLAIGAVQLALVLPAYPYFYSYWNPLLGGGAVAAETLPVGSGEGLDKAIDVLNQFSNAEHLTLICGASRSWCEGAFKGTTWSYDVLNTGDWMQADYVLLYISWLQRQSYPQEVVDYLSSQYLVYPVELGGAAYAWLYQVPQLQYYSGTKLEGRGTLYGYNLSATQLRAGDTLNATLYWRNEGQGPTDVFFVKIVDAAGYPWATAVAQPRPGFEEASRTRKAIVESEASLSLPIGMPPGHYFLKMGFMTDDGQTLVGRFELPPQGDDVLVTLPVSFPVADEISVPHTLSFATDDVLLLGYDLMPTAIRAGETGWLTLFWRARQDAPRDYVIGIRLLTLDAQEITYWLGRPVYSGYPTSQWSQEQVVQDPWELSLPADVPPGDYHLDLTLFDAKTQAEVARGTLGSVSVVERRRSFEIPTMQNVINADLGDQIRLLGYDLFAEPISDGGRLQVTLYWQAQEAISGSYMVFVHLLAHDGSVVAQSDGVPVGGAMPTHGWAAGEVAIDQHLLEFPDLPPGEYRLVVGVVDAATGERLPAADGNTFILLQTFRKD
jgi:4-amino-4-deoxy-L-arabinose transferase-like glycosyltransferase